MNKTLLLSLGILSSLTHAAYAQETRVSNVASTEPCLIGDATGVCSEGDERSPFYKQPSLLGAIATDLNYANGVHGRFVRVGDDRDSFFKKVTDAGDRGVRVRVRSRYQGAPYSFGIILGVGSVQSYLRYLSGAKYSAKGKVFLQDCRNYLPAEAGGKERCAEFDQGVALADSSMTEIKLPLGQAFQFAIERVSDVTDVAASVQGLSSAVSALTNKVTELSGKRGQIVASYAANNVGGQDQMVTFRFSEKVRTVEGDLATTYVLAFNDDGSNRDDAQFNDYVVEVQFVEPSANAQ